MNKITKIIIGVVVVIAIVSVVVGIALMNSKPTEKEITNSTTEIDTLNTTSKLPEVKTVEELSAIVDSIYEGQTIEMPMVQTQVIEVTDNDMVNSVTGLENSDDVEFVVASEPLMSSQAYSLVLVKVKDGVNAEKIAKTMNENINARKWVCVTAEKVYTTSSRDIVCLVMSNEETAKPIYKKFKTLAGSVGEEYERTEAEPELPEDMY